LQKCNLLHRTEHETDADQHPSKNDEREHRLAPTPSHPVFSTPVPSILTGARELAGRKHHQRQVKGMALAYIDARDVMQRLDEAVGPDNWQCRYPITDHAKKLEDVVSPVAWGHSGGADGKPKGFFQSRSKFPLRTSEGSPAA
jgi:hypothetical protein